MDKISKLTKAIILDITIGGLLYFYILFPQLRDAKINDRRFKNIINHIRGERKPSLSCYYKGDRWYLYDHADPDFSGDMFTVYAIVNKIKDVAKNFTQILEGIYRAVTGEEAPEVETENPVKMEKIELPEGVKYEIEEVVFDALGNDEKAFLQKHGMSVEDFNAFNAVFLSSYSFGAQSGQGWKIPKPDGNVIIGYKYKESVKVYKPYDDEYKFMWLGEKPKDYVFGLHQLKDLYNKLNPKNPDRKSIDGKVQIVLCAGEKDTLVAKSLGFTAICLNSETSTFFPENLLILLLDINDFCDELELVIVYDKDATGKKQAERIVEKQSKYDYAIRVVELPGVLNQNGGKDISDWIALGLPKEELVDLIKGDGSPSPISPVSPRTNILKEDIVDYNITNTSDNVMLYNVDNSSSLYSSRENCAEGEMSEIEDDPVIEPEIGNCSENLTDDSNFRHSGGVALFSDKVYDSLPTLFKKAVQPFTGEHKTMMLLSFLTAIGAVQMNVVGKFRKDRIFPNLYTIIIAPPASGKSLIKWARHIVMSVQRFLIQESKNQLADYITKKELVSKGELDREELGSKPPYKVLLLSADITSAMYVKQLSENNGYGLMYDTEIDSLVESNSGSLRSFSDYLRKASEGEPISMMRKTDDERIVVEEGKMSLLLSGTPQQFFKLSPDAENGLFSRMVLFKFNGNDEWLDAFELDDEIDYNEYFDDISDDVFTIFEELELYENDPAQFHLTKDQLIALDKEFAKRLDHVKNIAGVDGRATVFRLGAITVKIAMILNITRRIEEDKLHNTNECYDEDFDTALAISGVILQHVISTLKLMNDERVENCFRGKKLDYFYALPDRFSYSESQELADEYGIKLRTAQKWVYEFRNKGFLINPEKGQFKKVG